MITHIIGNKHMSDINDLLQELRENYIAELPERIETMEGHVLELNKNKELYDFQELYRQVHSHKGSAGTHGVHIISSICHQFEDELSKVDNNLNQISDNHINNWLAYLDLLKESYSDISAGITDTTRIEDALNHLRNTEHKTDFSCLLVDTKSSTLAIIESILKDNSIHVTVMDDGYQALGRLLTTKYDILICGMEIAMLNGTSLISASKNSNGINKNIPSVLITTSDFERTVRNTDPDFIIAKNTNLPLIFDKACKDIIMRLENN